MQRYLVFYLPYSHLKYHFIFAMSLCTMYFHRRCYDSSYYELIQISSSVKYSLSVAYVIKNQIYVNLYTQ